MRRIVTLLALGALQAPRARGSPDQGQGVRQAINYAVNVDEVIKNVLEGNGIRTATMLTANHFGFDPKIQPYRQDVA